MDKLDLILEKLGNMDQGINQMQKDIGNMKQDISNMQHDIRMLDTRQSELNQMVSSIRDNQLTQRAEHDALVHDVAEIKGKLDHISESQDRQDKILESLSLRSLEQETEIRELKRIK